MITGLNLNYFIQSDKLTWRSERELYNIAEMSVNASMTYKNKEIFIQTIIKHEKIVKRNSNLFECIPL